MKKRVRIMALLLVLCIAAFQAPALAAAWDGCASFGFAGGKGTEQSPYVIETARQLAFFAANVNGGDTMAGKHVALSADIQLNDVSSFTRWDKTAPANAWTPIGTLTCPFSGTFDGCGHSITGLYIKTSEPYQGLFGCVSGGSVKNVNVNKAYISGGSYVGGIAGRLYADKSTGGSASVAGCRCSGSVSGGGYVGGIAGHCYAYLSGSTVTVSGCCNTANVTGTSYNVGGIAGRNMANPVSADSSAFAYITDCCNTGKVTGTDYVGGIAGQSSASAFSTASAVNCLSTGAVSGGTHTGGIVGQSCASDSGVSLVKNAYYLADSASVGAVKASGGGTETEESVIPVTSEQLRSEGAFEGFDFKGVWQTDKSEGCPVPIFAAVRKTSAAVWENPFKDVSEKAYFYNAVRLAYTGGLMNGTGSSSFSPELPVTRAMAVTVLWRLSGCPSASGKAFSDVQIGAYYETAVSWAAKSAIVSGYGDGTFRPDADVTRQELAAMLCNYCKSAGFDLPAPADISKYSDADDVSPWAAEAMSMCVGAGIITGTSKDSLSPIIGVSRADAAVMVSRLPNK